MFVFLVEDRITLKQKPIHKQRKKREVIIFLREKVKMQAAKKAVETIKETAANIGASAKSGLEKTKATVQEKVFFFLIPIPS